MVGISCVYVYAVVFSWYLVRVSVRSGVLDLVVVTHVLHLQYTRPDTHELDTKKKHHGINI